MSDRRWLGSMRATWAVLLGMVMVFTHGLTPAYGQEQAGAAPVAASAAKEPAAQAAAREIETYREHLYFLANPFMEGRGPGTRGNEIAAEYIETHLAIPDLRPAFSKFDPADLRAGSEQIRVESRQPFTAGMQAKTKLCEVGSDLLVAKMDRLDSGSYEPLGFSGSGKISAPVACVGYGIQKGGPDKSYSTFRDGDDLRGTIALLLRFEPMDNSGHSKWRSKTDGGLWSPAASLTSKIQEVVKRKPAGLILVTPPGADDPRAGKLDAPEATSRWMTALDVPAVTMTAEAAARLVKALGCDQSFLELRKNADENGGVRRVGGRELSMNVDLDRSPRTTWNIAATLPGSGDLASQYIIIGAHYDHVGYGYTGGSRSDEYGIVHPGADDNASGTAGLLLAAEILKRRFEESSARLGEPGHQEPGHQEPGHKDKPRRSIMFVAFSAEEMGLIGSREFIKNCPVSASSIDAMLNMDMIGRLRENKLEISGTGTAKGFDAIVKPLFDSSGLTIRASPGGRGPSDHATFYGARIPVLAFFTGLHEEYHTPRDTVDLINVDGAVKVVHLVCDIAEMLATRPEQLEFTSTDKAGASEPGAPQASMGNLKVRFGIAPGNYADEHSGVLVGEVFPGTCAAEAGILPGDRLIRWAGEPILDVANWMTFLAKQSPGDVVDIGIVRSGQEQTVRITLKSRDQAPK